MGLQFFQFSQPCGVGGNILLLKTGSMDNRIQEFLLGLALLGY